jgi:hypothetical protein
MRIRSNRDYRRALDELKQPHLQNDKTRRRELEAAVATYAIEHDNSRASRGRPPAGQRRASPRLPED